jgi:ferrous iron transport protein B
MPLGVVDALIVTIARHEAGAGMLIRMADAGKLDTIQCMEAVLLTTIFVPCFANIIAMCRRVGTKTGLLMTGVMNVSAFVLVSAFHWVLVSFKGVFP